MLWTFFSAPAKLSTTQTLVCALLTLDVAIAAGTTVDDSETDKINYSDGWVQCPGPYPACMGVRLNAAHNQTLHQSKNPNTDGNLYFDFTFIGTCIKLCFIAIPNYNPNVNAMIDKEEMEPVVDAQTHCIGYRPPGGVAGLSNVRHILRVDFLEPSVLSFDYLIYGAEGSIGSPNSTAASTGTDVTTGTNVNEVKITYSEIIAEGTTTGTLGSFNSLSSSTAGSTGNALSKSRIAPGPMVGGSVAGITVFILAIAGVLLYRFKKQSRNGESQRTTPFAEEYFPERPSSDSNQV